MGFSGGNFRSLTEGTEAGLAAWAGAARGAGARAPGGWLDPAVLRGMGGWVCAAAHIAASAAMASILRVGFIGGLPRRGGGGGAAGGGGAPAGAAGGRGFAAPPAPPRAAGLPPR